MNPELYDLSLDKVEKLFGLKENLRPRGSEDLPVRSKLFPEIDEVDLMPGENSLRYIRFSIRDSNPLIFLERLNEKYGENLFSDFYHINMSEGGYARGYVHLWKLENGTALRLSYNNMGSRLGDKRILRWITSVAVSNSFGAISKVYEKLDDPTGLQGELERVRERNKDILAHLSPANRWK